MITVAGYDTTNIMKTWVSIKVHIRSFQKLIILKKKMYDDNTSIFHFTQ